MDKLLGLRQVASSAYQEALLAANPEEAVLRHLRVKGDILLIGDVDYFLNKFKRVVVIGAGKASGLMARAIEGLLSDRIDSGLVVVKHGLAEPLRHIKVRAANHPVPDRQGLKATKELIEHVEPLDENDLVICLISGGGSSLLEAPSQGLNLEDLQTANDLFLASGMNINEINCVRKHLSRIKGGRLATMVYPASLITLILSDVVGDRLDVIASGPTVADPTTYQDAADILKRHKVWADMPASVINILEQGLSGEFEDTPDKKSIYFQRTQNVIIGSNILSLEAAYKSAVKAGMNSMILSSSVAGEAREIAHFYAAIARECHKSAVPLGAPCCIIAGGEPTVTIAGSGKGGRSQELALATALATQDVPQMVFMAAGTDGIDGPTDAAGAIVDSKTIERATELGLDPYLHLTNNDSNPFFKTLDDLVITGPTGTNVMDIHILLVG